MKIILPLLFLMLLVSCDKEETPVTIPPEPSVSYYPLSTGSYWVYQHYHENQSGEMVETSVRDSFVVTGDTVLNGSIYTIHKNFGGAGNPTLTLLRDSSGYIVNSIGDIIMSNRNESDTIRYDTIFTNQSDPNSWIGVVKYRLDPTFENIVVPSGSFQCIDFEGSFYMRYPIEGLDNPRLIHNYYAEDIGRINSVLFYVSSDTKVERRLVDYHIE
jgi:hypothetical protein